MKQIITSIIMVTFMLFSFSVYSMPIYQWGFKAGYTAARQNWEHDWISNDDISLHSGIHVGVFSDWFNYRGLSLNTSVEYEQKGLNYTFMEVSQTGYEIGERTFSSRLDYISVSFLLKYTKGIHEYSGYFLVGPRFDIFLGVSEGEDNFNFGIEDDYKDLVFGLSGGFGVEKKLQSSRKIFIEFQYDYDPLWLYESTNIMTGNAFKVKNQSFNISIGFGL